VNLVDGFVPVAPCRFDIFKADGGITIGSNGLLFDMPAGFSWEIVNGDTIRLTYVPEPATLCIMALGGLLIARRRA
jgi:hypothetical protein